MKTYYNVNVGISKRTGSSRCIIEKVDKEKVKCNRDGQMQCVFLRAKVT